MPRQTQWNDGAPETTWYAPNETKEFYQYWDSDQRVADGKARKAEWDAMDPNKARSIRRARRKARKQGNVPGLPAGMGRPRTVRNRNEQPRQQPRQEPISYFDAPTRAGGPSGDLNQYGDPNDTVYAGGSPTFNERTGQYQPYTGSDGVTRTQDQVYGQPNKGAARSGGASRLQERNQAGREPYRRFDEQGNRQYAPNRQAFYDQNPQYRGKRFHNPKGHQDGDYTEAGNAFESWYTQQNPNRYTGGRGKKQQRMAGQRMNMFS